MHKTIIITQVLFYLCFTLSAQDFTSFECETNKEAHSRFIKLYTDGNYEEAAKVLKSNYQKFEQNLEANAFNLAITLGKLNRLDEGLEVLTYGLDKGVWYNVLGLQSQIFAPFHGLEEFEKVVARNQAVCDSLQDLARADYLVVVPENLKKKKKYPLFVGLHGAGGNIKDFPGIWTSDLIKEEYISLYIQSSQLVAPRGYTWSNNMHVSVSEIDSIVKLVCDKYPINQKAIILSGFSSGGNAAMEVALQNRFAVRGFISLCPDKPDSWDEENIKKARDRSVTGILLTTELDPRVAVQQEMADELNRLGMRNYFFASPNTGHWIPDDLPEQLDLALKRILE